MVIEFTREMLYIGIIVVLCIIQIWQWRKIYDIETAIEFLANDLSVIALAADVKFALLDKKIEDAKKSKE